MAIRTFVCLSRNFAKRGDDFTFHTIKARSADIAWQMVEESIATTSSQDWLMTPDDFYVLKKFLDNRVKIFREKGTLNEDGLQNVSK
ncbi:MAG: hypothetical protein A2879_05125 [Omnitrophica WOR_2 bacterium RIFCSPHIGHO2_01_FULL_49_10]|nr:MAG: hypothetical protein A3H12_00760 [Candidatus Uhrbacteria bacterium RIFCSPLOWO2_12_FULL_47_9]OGX29669.1 MAG: hypothetical protein A2879_05125 [Omnitrophica WOR_2 bacterium RIFCSPHIGHO2_01_FULL_49_10]OGX32663.1 MAG: hypothetical protein A3I43_03265 [Omnitrophica WOR_2 bacterium RIFCSPLOWO2_02_FULL_50_19]